MRQHVHAARRKSGQALLVIVLWAVAFMSLLVSSLIYNMHIEADLTDLYRKRIAAENMAYNGYEWAKFLLIKQASGFSDEELYGGEEWRIKLQNLKKGLDVRGEKKNPAAGEFEGDFTVDIVQEPAYRNVNMLDELEWEALLDNAGVPQDGDRRTERPSQAELIDCFMDWTDKGDAHRLNGAEQDDKYYDDKDYEVKNGPLDTIDELLLIKGFSEEIVFGTDYVLGLGKESQLDEDDLEDGMRMRGIVRWLTTFGTGKVNVNSAPTQVLMTLPELDADMIAAIQEWRLGPDLARGTEDDGFTSVEQVLSVTGLDSSFASRITVNDNRYIRIVSTGEAPGDEGEPAYRFVIRTTVRQEGTTIIPLSWREELLP